MAAYRPGVLPLSIDIYHDLDYALLPPSPDDFILIAQQANGEANERKIRFADLIPPILASILPVLAQQTINFYYTVTQNDLNNGGFDLGITPNSGLSVSIVPQGGIQQFDGIDFIVQGTSVVWQQMALELLVEVGSVLMVSVETTAKI